MQQRTEAVLWCNSVLVAPLETFRSRGMVLHFLFASEASQRAALWLSALVRLVR